MTDNNQAPYRSKTVSKVVAILSVLALVIVALSVWMRAASTEETATSTLTTTEQSTDVSTEPVAAPSPTSSSPAAVTATALPAEACAPATFQQAGHDFVDTVLFCEDGWARGGLEQSDHVRNFQWREDSWHEVEATGESFTGFPCYDTEAMAEAGAPHVLLLDVLDCRDADAGLH